MMRSKCLALVFSQFFPQIYIILVISFGFMLWGSFCSALIGRGWISRFFWLGLAWLGKQIGWTN